MVCSRCHIGMTTREQRGNPIPKTRFYSFRRLVCQCMTCAGVVFVNLKPTKAEAEARKTYAAATISLLGNK